MTICGGTTGGRGRAYPGCVDGIAGLVLALRAAGQRVLVRVGPAARWLWRGLAGVLAGGDPAPVWRSPWQRRATYGGLAAVTVLLAGLSLASVPRLGGPAGLWDNSMFSFKGNVAAPRRSPLAGQALQHKITAVHGFTVANVAVIRQAGLLPFNGPIWATTLDVLVALAVVVPVALAARYPLLGWRLGWAGLWLVPWAQVVWRWGWVWGPVLLPGVVVCFAVAGVRQPRPVLWWMWAASLVPWLWHEGLSGTGVAGCLGLAAAGVAADAMAARRRAQVLAAGEAERAELEQARRAVLEERARIARELHDVVAHHLSLIAVRAESAPYRLAGLDRAVGAEFGSLSGAAREALADMRRLLGVLRAEGAAAARAPQPQLADVPDLVAAARRAGVAVALDGPPAWAPVPAGVGVCAYRIVQESLSNASRHAPGAEVTVTVGHHGDAVCLRVVNGPGHLAGEVDAAGRAEPAGPGHGLAGMRERVALLGGSLIAGPAPGGGFMVSATLPLTQAA
jgi:signal transduction histidine kinase